MPGDVDAALNLLTSQDVVNKTVVGVVGGSCGVNQAIAARRRAEVKTLVLLSSGTDADGKAFIKSSAKMPLFCAASEEDKNAAASIKKILSLSRIRKASLQCRTTPVTRHRCLRRSGPPCGHS